MVINGVTDCRHQQHLLWTQLPRQRQAGKEKWKKEETVEFKKG